MSRNPILSPTRDNDVLILEEVVRGVFASGAQVGLTAARRRLLAHTLQTLIRSLREGWETEFSVTLTTLQMGRPSQPEGRDGGDPDLSRTPPELTR